MFSAQTSTSSSRTRISGSILVILLLTVGTAAAGQNPPLAVRAVGRASFEARTRDVVSVALAVENTAAQPRTLVFEQSLPEGWKVVTPQPPLTLAPSSSEIRIASFLVAPLAASGAYTVTYRVKDSSDPSLSAECSIAVTVLPRTSLEMKLLESPPFVLAGSEYTATFVISNTGNTPVDAQVSIVSGPAFPWEIHGLEKGEAVLPAGDARQFSVTVRTDPALTRAGRHYLQVTAAQVEPELAPAGPPLATASSSVEVVPLSLDSRVINHTIPVTSETTGEVAYGSAWSASLQQEIRAIGSLDDAGEHRIDVDLLKRLDTSQDLLFDPADRYSVQYRSRYGELKLGDLAYTVSPLLALDRFSRGAQGTVNLRPFRAGAFYFQDAWSAPGARGAGGTVDFSVPRSGNWDSPLYRAGVSVLSPLTDGAVLGLFQEYRPGETVDFQLDAAMETGSAGLVPAFYAYSEGTLGSVSWVGRFIRASTGFDGTWTDTQSIAAATGVNILGSALSVNALFNLTDANLAMNPALLEADRTMEIGFGARSKVPGLGMDVSANWEGWKRIDRFPSPLYSSWENIFRARIRQPLPPVVLGLSSMVGARFDELARSSVIQQEHILTAELDFRSAWRWGLSLSYNGSSDPTGAALHLAGWGVSALYNAGRTYVEGQVTNKLVFTDAGFSQLIGGISASFVHELPWKHTLTARADFGTTYDLQLLQPVCSVSVGYRVPFDVPVSRKPDTMVVRGRVLDAATGKGMPGVLLRLNGLAAISGPQGAFTFYVPGSGQRHILVDAGTTRRNMVTVQPLPLPVSGAPGSTVSLDIAMVEACTVSGTVSLYGFTDETAAFRPAGSETEGAEQAQPEQVRRGGLANAIVELSGQSEVRRALTTAGGDYRFDEVRPGRYTLRISGGRIPSFHAPRPASIELDLAPGQDASADFQVRQEQRAMKLLEPGAPVVVEEQK